MTEVLSAQQARLQRVELALLALMLALFVYRLSAYLGWIGGDPPWRPLSGLLLSGGMLLQAVGAIVGRRSRIAQYLLLAGSFVAMILSLNVRA